jgi:hypothetical protein
MQVDFADSDHRVGHGAVDNFHIVFSLLCGLDGSLSEMVQARH